MKSLFSIDRIKDCIRNKWELYSPKLWQIKQILKVLWDDRFNPHCAFSIIWLVTFVSFCLVFFTTIPQLYTTLPLYTPTLPEGFINMDGIDIANPVNGIIKSHNETVTLLQESIISSALTTVILNFVSALLALWGFVTQLQQYAQEKSQKHNVYSHSDAENNQFQ